MLQQQAHYTYSTQINKTIPKQTTTKSKRKTAKTTTTKTTHIQSKKKN